MEQIVWPHVKTLLLQRLDEISQQINDSSSSSPSSSPSSPTNIVVVEAAVLLDANWDDNNLFDAIWVIQSSSQVSTDRLVTYRNMKKEDALKRLEAQTSRRGIGNIQDEIDNGSVTAVITNNGDCSEILWDDIRKRLIDSDSWKDGRCLTDDKLKRLLSFEIV